MATRNSFKQITDALLDAIAADMKTVHRELLLADNTLSNGYRLDALDFDSGRPHAFEEAPAFGGLVVKHGETRRPVLLEPQRPYLPREDQTGLGRKLTMIPTGVRAERLHQVTNDDAIAEGVGIFLARAKVRPNNEADLLEAWPIAFRTLAEELPTRSRNHWHLTELGEGRGANAPREIFALSWVLRHGVKSWAENPWVWRWEFAVAPIETREIRKNAEAEQRAEAV